MKGRNTFDFWYAVNNTEVLVMPTRHLETFGTTVLHYHLVSELMDAVGQVRVREGRMLASQPQIITPQAYSKTLLEGFGEEATRYVEWLKGHEKDIRILQYGYRLRQESFTEQIVTDDKKAVVERVQNEVRKKGDPLSAVVIGVDDPWDVCLIKLFWEVVQNSAHTNVKQLTQRHMFEESGGVPKGIRAELERAFLEASRNPALVNALGQRLQEFGLFEEYQDRFFALIRPRRKA
ncbi:MAG: hypothetical protein O3B24_08700 [Verrucomicrobia bacterium]|nr:hypothetical protein [Verrucomicrobiota bacterium]